MKYLIDTHVFIGFFSESEKIKTSVRTIPDNSKVKLDISLILFYEIQQKKLLGKLDFEPELAEILNINVVHTLAMYDLPLIRRDPFNRILVAQSIVEKIPTCCWR